MYLPYFLIKKGKEMKITTSIKKILIPASLIFSLCAQAAPIVKEYRSYEIQTFLSGFQESVTPTAMNETGQVTGNTSTTGETSAFLFNGHETINLGPLSSRSRPADINAYIKLLDSYIYWKMVFLTKMLFFMKTIF